MMVRAEFFDIFGIAVFIFIMIISLWVIRTQRPLPNIFAFILLVIGIFGFIIDSVMVYTAYLK